MKTKLLTRALLSAAVLLSVAAPGVQAQTAYKPEYRLSTNVNNAFPLGRGAEEWARLVKERTDGRINVKWYPGSSLVGGETTREFTALRRFDRLQRVVRHQLGAPCEGTEPVPAALPGA